MEGPAKDSAFLKEIRRDELPPQGKALCLRHVHAEFLYKQGGEEFTVFAEAGFGQGEGRIAQAISQRGELNTMDVMEAIKKRCSVRSYQNRPVEREKLDKILEAARLAPSASNRQEWRFIVVQDKETRKRLAQAARNQTFVGEAPVIIVCCAKTDNHVMTCGQMCYPIDVAIAIEHMALKATEEGLGTCWIGAFHEEKVKEILVIPQDIRIVELFILGYPAKPSSGSKDRLSIEEIVMHDKWRK